MVIIFAIASGVTMKSFSSLKSARGSLWEETDYFVLAKNTVGFLEAQYNENIPGRVGFIEVNGLFQRLALKSFVEDALYDRAIIKDNNGFLHFRGWMYSADLFQPEAFLNDYLDFYKHLEKEKIPLIYIAAPEKYVDGYTIFPPTLVNYGNDVLERFLYLLQETNLPYIDLREGVSKVVQDKTRLYYKTDHHWTNYAAFLGFQSIVNGLNEELGFQIDEDYFFRHWENHIIKEYPASFVGAQGRRVGKYYAGVDDYTLISPKFPTNYRMVIDDKDLREGDFISALIFKEFLDDSDIYANKYAAYLGGDYSHVTITNRLQSEYKLMIIKDSYANPTVAFLSTCVSEIKLVDLRYYKESLYELAEQYRPDAVMVIYSSDSIVKRMFEFNKDSG